MGKGKSNGSRRRASASEADLSRFQEGRWNLPRCFIIHAWSPAGMKHVISHIKTALKDNFHVIVDQDFGAGESIRKQALEGIRDAALVVAVVDDLRPNVVFELGYALALGKPCIPLVREGAVVNVRDYFPKKECGGVENPALDMNAHFSDLKDLKWCPYDHEDPASPGAVIADELSKKGADGRSLGRRALETWVAVLRSAYEPQGKCFDELYEYLACPHALDSFQPGIRWNRRHG
jgi:nucleoside 2-deoxyribosyltransferase